MNHTVTDCPNLAKRSKLEEDTNTENRQKCNTPEHDGKNCYFSGNLEKRQPMCNLTEARKNGIETYKQARNQ